MFLKSCVAASLPFVLLAAQLRAQEAIQSLRIEIVEGDGAINNVRQRFAREPIVQVEDENRKPVAGAVVTFVLPNQGASGVFPNGARTLTTITDNNGRAVARGLRPTNNGKFEIRVNASKDGKTASTTIGVSNVLAAAAITGAKLALLLAIAGGAAAGIAVAVNNSGGGGGVATPPATPPTVLTPGNPTVGGPR